MQESMNASPNTPSNALMILQDLSLPFTTHSDPTLLAMVTRWIWQSLQSLPKVGAYDGGDKKPMFDWTEAHNELSQTPYALFASHGMIAISTVQSANMLASYQFSGSGLQVLQDLLCLHHPWHSHTQAPPFLSVKGTVPVMPLATVITGDQLASFTRYFMAFGNWEAHLKLYPDAKYMRETDFHLLFLDGLTAVLKS